MIHDTKVSNFCCNMRNMQLSAAYLRVKSKEIQGAYASGTFAKGEAAGDVDATEMSGVSMGTSSGTYDNTATPGFSCRSCGKSCGKTLINEIWKDPK